MSAPFPGPKGPPSDNRGPMLLQSQFIMTFFAFAFLVARNYTRIVHIGGLRWDDYLMTLSWVLSLIAICFIPSLVNAGFGRHVYYLLPAQLTQISKISFISQPITVWSGIFGRISFAVSLMMLMWNVRWSLVLLWFITVTQISAASIFTGVNMFGCSPISKSWHRELQGTCLGRGWARSPGYMLLTCIIFADLVLALMPALIISRLNLRRRLKIGLVVLMSLGLFNMAAAIGSLVTFVNVPTASDFTYEFIPPNIWGGIQANLVIVAASIPFLRPLFQNNKFLTWSFYRSFITRLSHRSRGESSDPQKLTNPSDNSLINPNNKKDGKSLGSLPHVTEDRFVTTTLKNARPGMVTEGETGFDSLSEVEEGMADKRWEWAKKR